MKNLKKYALFIAMATLMFACKKEHLQQGTTTNGAPVFSFTGLVNGMPVSFQAGINNYYMYSSYTQDANNVYNFTGTLQPVGCNGCANTIKITINDYKTTAIGAPATIDSSLVAGYYSYTGVLGGVSSAYSVTFTPRPYDTTITYNWNFGDGHIISTNYAPTHIYSHPGNYNVTLTVPTICGSTISNPSNIGTPKASFIPVITVVKDSSTDTIYLGASASGGTGPYTYLWNFSDGYTSSSVTPSHFLNPGTYQISLTATDKTGLQSSVALDTGRLGDSLKCSINFSSHVNPNPNPKAFSNLNITYADASGNVYTSANAKQSTSSFFQILSVSNYQNNENNQTTKQLHIQFSCKLVDTHSDTIQITNGQAVIAVAYK